MNDAPLVSLLRSYADEHTLRLHMPGHKGKSLPLELDRYLTQVDFTELSRTGNLYSGGGAIGEAEKLCAELYGAASCMFMTNGSTGGVQSILGYLCRGKKLLADRSAHKCVSAAAALYDIHIDFILPKISSDGCFALGFDTETLESMLRTGDYTAFLVTSPTYYGVRLNLRDIASICHRHGVELIVDSAHGAHFPSLGIPSAIEEGADYAVLSMHKTTPALGQSAIVLSSADIDGVRRFASITCTSSPSYAVMASIDAARWSIDNERDKYLTAAKRTEKLREFIRCKTKFRCPDRGESPDPCRLVINTLPINGYEAYDILESLGCVCEMADVCGVVMIITGEDSEEDFEMLRCALIKLNGHSANASKQPTVRKTLPERACSMREAILGEHERVVLSDSIGKISAENITIYPPGAIIFGAGEKIDKLGIEILKENGYNINGEIYILK